MRGEPLPADAVTGGQFAYFPGIISPGWWTTSLRGGNHQVLRRVLGGDELEDFRVVTRPFQQCGTQGVGDELSLSLEQNAMAQSVREHGRRAELRAQFLVATR